MPPMAAAYLFFGRELGGASEVNPWGTRQNLPTFPSFHLKPPRRQSEHHSGIRIQNLPSPRGSGKDERLKLSREAPPAANHRRVSAQGAGPGNGGRWFAIRASLGHFIHMFIIHLFSFLFKSINLYCFQNITIIIIMLQSLAIDVLAKALAKLLRHQNIVHFIK